MLLCVPDSINQTIMLERAAHEVCLQLRCGQDAKRCRCYIRRMPRGDLGIPNAASLRTVG